MNKFRFISAILLIAAVPVLFSCSKHSSSEEEETAETFQSIHARFYFSNSSLAPENIAMETGGTVEVYVGNGSTKAIFNGPVKWEATGSGEVGLSAVQKTVGQAAPLTKAGYGYSTSSATTNATTVLKITAKSDGIVSIKASDAARNTKVLMVTIYAKD